MDPIDWIAAQDRAWKRLGNVVPPVGIDLPAGGLMDFVPLLNRRFVAPRPLQRLVDVLERAAREPVRAVVHGPPRVGKTECILVSPAYWLRQDPSIPLMYFGHSESLARSKSSKARGYALDAGVRLSTSSKSKTEWLVVDENGRETGGGMRAFGIDGGSTGHGARIILIDDPIKDRRSAESLIIRDQTWETINSTLMARLEPGGSAILIMQRWHPDDPAGRAIAEGWEYVCITPFENDDEVTAKSFWPDRFPDHHWHEIRDKRGSYVWNSQYMGRPAPREGRAIPEPRLCKLADIPTSGIAEAIGVDLSHTNRSRSDPHAAISWLRAPDVEVTEADPTTGKLVQRTRRRFYITDCRHKMAPLTTVRDDRGRVETLGFTTEIIRLRAERPIAGRRLRMYYGGQESVLLELLRKLPPDERVDIEAIRADNDKYVRSRPMAAACGNGEVYVPADAPWARDLLAEFAQFTGNAHGIDNRVDAASAGFDVVASTSGGPRGRARGTGEGSVRDKLGGVYGA